jgi:hypothetical protein
VVKLSPEEKTPYFSKRIRIGDMKPTKDTLGLRYKERTFEVTMGNAKETVTVVNPADIADVKSQSMKDIINDMVKDSDELAVEHKWTYIDKLEKKE